uniref:Uncharacterized protein n=1 Tax=Anguilla anguilla TaxID=7936 RepID=A0A0E9V340_ANGAN
MHTSVQHEKAKKRTYATLCNTCHHALMGLSGGEDVIRVQIIYKSFEAPNSQPEKR